MRSDDLLLRLNLLNQLELQRRELEAQIEAIKDSVKAEMITRNTDEIHVGSYNVSWKYYTHPYFDTSSFKAEHGDLYNQYSKSTKARRFLLH